MPLGATSSEKSSGENISHYAAIRIRTYGIGQLLLSVFSLDDVKEKKLVPLKMALKNRIIPTRLVNFKGQRASFELKTVGPNEILRIHRIVLFVRESESSYPGS